MSSMEFGVKHYAGQVWYNVEGFLDKNRDTLRYDVMALLISSKDKLISKMFLDLHNLNETTRTMHKANGQFITMKPRTPTVAARFQVYIYLYFLVKTMLHAKITTFFFKFQTCAYSFFSFRSLLAISLHLYLKVIRTSFDVLNPIVTKHPWNLTCQWCWSR